MGAVAPLGLPLPPAFRGAALAPTLTGGGIGTGVLCADEGAWPAGGWAAAAGVADVDAASEKDCLS